MKPPKLTYDQLNMLPPFYTVTIPPEYEDENGHMNFRWYFELFNEGALNAFADMGITMQLPQERKIGIFDMEYHVHFINEVLIGDQVSVRFRMVGRSEKRVHCLVFIVNETRQQLAAMFECVSTFVSIEERRTVSIPDDICPKVDARLAEHTALDWAAPVCGVMGA